ncbi:MAG TPA: hypothetical protein DD414_04830 [Lachnospiraceae bacterium]|nr:hypothetical protein [Lachnospiraceae bacterium]
MGRKDSIEEVPIDKIRLVQCYEDEFTLNHYWDIFRREREERSKAQVTVLTNSDYVMNDLLRNTDLGNISGDCLGHQKTSPKYPGVSLYGEEKPVVFGYIFRKEESLSLWTERFIEFIKGCL